MFPLFGKRTYSLFQRYCLCCCYCCCLNCGAASGKAAFSRIVVVYVCVCFFRCIRLFCLFWFLFSLSALQLMSFMRINYVMCVCLYVFVTLIFVYLALCAIAKCFLLLTQSNKKQNKNFLYAISQLYQSTYKLYPKLYFHQMKKKKEEIKNKINCTSIFPCVRRSYRFMCVELIDSYVYIYVGGLSHFIFSLFSVCVSKFIQNSTTTMTNFVFDPLFWIDHLIFSFYWLKSHLHSSSMVILLLHSKFQNDFFDLYTFSFSFLFFLFRFYCLVSTYSHVLHELIETHAHDAFLSTNKTAIGMFYESIRCSWCTHNLHSILLLCHNLPYDAHLYTLNFNGVRMSNHIH